MRRALPLVLLPLLAGCGLLPSGGADEPRACLEYYATLTVRVVDEAGRPLDGLAAASTNTRTGAVLASGASPTVGPGDGHYEVAADDDLERVRAQGDPVRFRAEGDGLVAEADYVIGHDGCHIVRVEGPEAVTARPE